MSRAPGAAARRRDRSHLVSLLAAGAAGALFGTGLLVSGMTQPARVLAFLDVTRRWDPRLALVMAAAVLVYALAYRRIRRRGAPWLGPRLHLPAPGEIDPPLVLGAALFGVGWGLAGLCPGPALVAAASGSAPALAFVVAMLAGMHVQHRSAR